MPPKKRPAHEPKASATDPMDFSVSVSPESGPPPTPEADGANGANGAVGAEKSAAEARASERSTEVPGLAAIAASLSRIETTLGSMERALDAVRGVCSVNSELVAANLAMRASSASSLCSASTASPASASSLCSGSTGPTGPASSLCSGSASSLCSGSTGSAGKVVSYILGATDVALVGNDHTFEMRAALKLSNAKWTTSAHPARWVVSQDAWAERRAEWEATFGVTFVERAP